MAFCKKKVKAARLRQGWNQSHLGFVTRRTQSEISKIENGWLVPSPAAAARLAEALGLRPEELYEDEKVSQ